jgi:hypothetical protein
LARGGSRVLEINPVKKEIVWKYDGESSGKPGWTFLSSFISSARRLPNGNTLIDEGHDGRFFQVTPKGEIVWEYVSLYFGSFYGNVPGVSRGIPSNWVYRAQPVPYDWVPAETPRSEKAVVPPGVLTVSIGPHPRRPWALEPRFRAAIQMGCAEAWERGCFRNIVPMQSGRLVDFVAPGMGDWLAIDVFDQGYQAVFEFLFGDDADLAEHGPREFGEARDQDQIDCRARADRPPAERQSSRNALQAADGPRLMLVTSTPW